MSNTNDLSTRRSLELLRQLQDTAGSTAQAEEALTARLRTRRFNVERKFQHAMKVVEDKLAAQTTENDTTTHALVQQVARAVAVRGEGGGGS